MRMVVSILFTPINGLRLSCLKINLRKRMDFLVCMCLCRWTIKLPSLCRRGRRKKSRQPGARLGPSPDSICRMAKFASLMQTAAVVIQDTAASLFISVLAQVRTKSSKWNFNGALLMERFREKPFKSLRVGIPLSLAQPGKEEFYEFH